MSALLTIRTKLTDIARYPVKCWQPLTDGIFSLPGCVIITSVVLYVCFEYYVAFLFLYHVVNTHTSICYMNSELLNHILCSLAILHSKSFFKCVFVFVSSSYSVRGEMFSYEFKEIDILPRCCFSLINHSLRICCRGVIIRHGGSGKN